MKRAHRIVCDPNPYCYGSISALRSLVRRLGPAEVAVLAAPPVDEQVGDGLFQRVIPCDVKDPAAVRAHAETIARADLYLAVANNTNVPLVLELGVPLVFVDILFWMKRAVTPAMRSARAYVIEQFPGVDEKLRELALGFTAPPVLVGPLIEPVVLPDAPAQAGRDVRAPRVLVNLGGGQSPDLLPGDNTPYAALATRLVLRAVDRVGRVGRVGRLGRLGQQSPLGGLGRDVELLVAGGRRAVADVNRALGEAVRAVTLPQPEFLAMLRQADDFVTAPGLNAVFEGFAAGVPTTFLPPQNLTQIHQLEVYQRAGLAPAGLNLTEVYPDLPIPASLSESEGTSRVRRLLTRLAQDPEAQETLAIRIAVQLARDPLWRGEQVAAQERWLHTLGFQGGGGAGAAAQVIQNVLGGIMPRAEVAP